MNTCIYIIFTSMSITIIPSSFCYICCCCCCCCFVCVRVHFLSEGEVAKDVKQVGSPLAPVQEGTEEYQEITEGKGTT